MKQKTENTESQEGGKNVMKQMFIMPIMLVALAMTVMAATNTAVVLTPVTSTTLAGTINLLAEVNGTNYAPVDGTGVSNVSSVAFQYSSDSGSTYTTAATNTTSLLNGTLLNWTISYNTNLLADVSTYTWRAVISNDTTTLVTTATVTSVTVDNTVPSMNFGSSTPSEGSIVTSSNLITFDTIDDSNASSCSVKINDGNGGTLAGSIDSNEACSKTVTLNDGAYSVTWTGDDGTNSTTSSKRSFRINAKGLTVDQVAEINQQQGAGTTTTTNTRTVFLAVSIGGVALILVAGTVVAMTSKTKKKGKRK